MKMWHSSRRRRILLCALSVATAFPLATADAQDETARMAWQQARRLAVAGLADSALAEYARAGAAAKAIGDQAIGTAVQRGVADVYLVYRGCADSAQRMLTDAAATAATGDRSAADALVRLLAARGNVTLARASLVKAYDDVPSVGRLIMRESVTFLQGMAAIERYSGHEAAAMSNLSSALQIATRLHEGDAAGPETHAIGSVTAENVWVMLDIAQLRLHAKSAGIASAREGTRMMEQLVVAWPTVSDTDRMVARFPVSRLADRLEIRAIGCAKSGAPCPAPKPPKC